MFRSRVISIRLERKVNLILIVFSKLVKEGIWNMEFCIVRREFVFF